MEKGHLTYEELERYIDDTDLSEEYLCFSEPLTAHLDACELCSKRLEKMLCLSQLLEEEQFLPAMKLVKKEEQIRRSILALRLEMMAEEQRILEVAMRLKMGFLLKVSVARTDFVKNQSVYRCGGVTEQKPVTVHYENGKACVSVECDKAAEVTVVLTPVKEKAAEIMVAGAKWDERNHLSIAEFAIEDLEDNYEIYVDIRER